MSNKLPDFSDGNKFKKKLLDLPSSFKKYPIFSFVIYIWVGLFLTMIITLVFLRSYSTKLNYDIENIKDHINDLKKDTDKLVTEVNERLTIEELMEVIKDLGLEFRDNIIPIN